MAQKSVLVLGAQGLLGHFTARAFQAAGYRVLRGGRRAEGATDFRLIELDNPQALAEVLAGVDLVVSSIEDTQLRVERQVLRQGGLMLLQATVPAPVRRAFAAEMAAGPATESVGTVVCNIGLSGISSLVIRELLEQHPEADAAELAYVIGLAGSAGPGGTRYAHRILVGAPRSRTVKRLFPAPYGMHVCFDLTGADECLMSPTLLGDRRLHTSLGIAEPPVNGFLRLLNRLGLLRHLPEIMFTGPAKLRPRPAELTREPIRARLAVHRHGQLLAARGIEADGDYNSSVQAAVHVANAALVRGKPSLPAGIHAVEDLFCLDELRDALANDRLLVRDLSA